MYYYFPLLLLFFIVATWLSYTHAAAVYPASPDLPTLSFFDLPGVIGARSPEKEIPKKLIDDLVIDYIENPNALVILTSSLETDWDTCAYAAQLVSKANATSRTVGVLTKPDRVDNDVRYNIVKKVVWVFTNYGV